jgi:hypothetical protein
VGTVGNSARRKNGTVLRGFRAVWALKTLWIRALGSAAIEKETCWEKASMKKADALPKLSL